jgi:hypothetical protein
MMTQLSASVLTSQKSSDFKPSGSTALQCICNELYGSDLHDDYVQGRLSA